MSGPAQGLPFAVGPLVPIGQVLPAVFANIARTMAANSNPPQNRRNKDMTEQEIDSLNTVINLFWRDEQKHFEDMKAAGDDTSGHVFGHLETLHRYVANARAADVSPFI